MTAISTRITAAALLVAGAIAGSAVGAAAPANADSGGPYVVIAYSPNNGARGWANNKDTLDEAFQAAMFNCRGWGGTQCQMGAWAHDSCAAVVSDGQEGDPGKWAGRGGEADTQGAEVAAQGANGGGQVVVSRCATGNQGSGS